jgi:DNA polymerase III alpha subunit
MTNDLDNIERLLSRFKRPVPAGKEYQTRLAEEFELILKQRFTEYFLKICDIIDITSDLTHMTRGSAGSSLVCYLLGITDVDPIKWRIPVARFMNPLRDDLPDVDIDFEHHKQKEVMNRIFNKWPGKTARLSNYVTYKEKSAKREAVKRLGVKGNLPRGFTYDSVGVDPVEAKRIEQKLMGKKRCISKHCGGVIMFDRQLPKSLITADNQILLDKYEVEDLEHLKVDILANRGLSQLLEIDADTPLADYPETDKLTSQLLGKGDILGVTQGESPAMRRLFRAIRPRSVHDCVFATALIRPVAMSGRQRASMFQNWSKAKINDAIVYEDDAIDIISSIIGVSAYEADMYRRGFAKKNDEKILEFIEKMGNHPKKDDAISTLEDLSGFGLCRAHAVNLGRLIWALAYQKAHNPKKFWEACLKHCEGSYRSWVYQTEAHRAGVSTKPGWWQHAFPANVGLWKRHQNYYEFSGLVANGRSYRCKNSKWITFLTLGYDYGKYIDIVVSKMVNFRDYQIVSGSGFMTIRDGTECIEVKKVKLDTYKKWVKNPYNIFFS